MVRMLFVCTLHVRTHLLAIEHVQYMRRNFQFSIFIFPLNPFLADPHIRPTFGVLNLKSPIFNQFRRFQVPQPPFYYDFNIYYFIGMKIKINMDKTVTIDMRDEINKAIEDFEKYDTVDTNVVSPATCYLFNVNPNAEQLNTRLSEAFYSITSKLGYIMKRGRPDIETAVSFLMIRVSKSDTDDWKKLRRLIGFLKGTIDELRIIGATSLTEIMTFVDSAYDVHENTRSHTGG